MTEVSESILARVSKPEDIELLTNAELAAMFNELAAKSGVRPVARFATRADGTRRCRAALTGAPPSVADKMATAAASLRPGSGKVFETLSVPQTADYPKSHKPNTCRGKIIDLCSKEGGASLAELMAATSWNERQVRACLRQIGIFLGHGVEEMQGMFLVRGDARTRRRIHWAPAKLQKGHRSGTMRARMMELLRSPGGATLSEIMAAVDGIVKDSGAVARSWTEMQAYEAVKIAHSYLGWGIVETREGRLHAFNQAEEVGLHERLGFPTLPKGEPGGYAS